jgi:hypothetical protein
MGCVGSKSTVVTTAVPSWTVPYDKVQRFPNDEIVNKHKLVDSNVHNVQRAELVSLTPLSISTSIPLSVHENKKKGMTKEITKSIILCELTVEESSLKCAANTTNIAKLADSKIDNDRNSALDLKNNAQPSQSPYPKLPASPVSVPLLPYIINTSAPEYENKCPEIREEKMVILSSDKIKSPVSRKATGSKKKCGPVIIDEVIEAQIATIMARRHIEREKKQQSPKGISPGRKRTISEENSNAKVDSRDSNEKNKDNKEIEEKEKEYLNIVANISSLKCNQAVVQEHQPFFCKIHGLGKFDSVRKKVAELLRDGNISQRRELVSSNDCSEPTHDYLLRRKVLSHSATVQVDHTLECQVISHCIIQTKEVHNILKEINLNSSRTEQSYVVKGLLTPVYDIHNGHDDMARTFNLHLMDANLNIKKGAAVKDFLSRQYITKPGEKGGEIRFQNYFKDATVVKEGLIDSDELVGKMEKLLRDVEDPYRNYLTTVRSVLSSKGVAEKRFEALSESVNQVYDKMFEGDRSR